MDFSSFDPQPAFLTAVRLSGVLFASALLMALCAYRCVPKVKLRQSVSDSAVNNLPVNDTTHKHHVREIPVNNNDNDDDNNNSNHMYISRVDPRLFRDIVVSHTASSCIYPSNIKLEVHGDSDDYNATGIIISNNQNDGVILFEVQDTFYSYQEMLDNDFAYDRKYPEYDTKYYYLIFTKLFLTRSFPGETASDVSNDVSNDDIPSDNVSTNSSEELPATAFYYAKIDDDSPDRGRFKRGTEMHMSAPSTPTCGKKELQI